MKIKNNKTAPKQKKSFFLEDSNGKLYKASPVEDEDIPLEADCNDEGEELINVQLTKAQYDKLMGLLGEDNAVTDGEDDPEEDKDEDDDDENVVDTKDSKSFIASSTANERKTKSKDTADESLDVNTAWSNRYANKN